MKDKKECFNKISNNLENIRNDFFSDNVRFVAYEAADVKEGTTVLDMGAGTGFITEGLIDKNIKVIALDQSEDMLNALKDKFYQYENLVCIKGIGENIPIKDKTVDYVFANMFLHNVENPIIVIKEMERILKPGGKLIITDLNKHNFEFLKTEQNDVWMGFDMKQIIEWLKDSGLNNITFNFVGSNYYSESRCNSQEAIINIFIAYAEKPLL